MNRAHCGLLLPVAIFSLYGGCGHTEYLGSMCFVHERMKICHKHRERKTGPAHPRKDPAAHGLDAEEQVASDGRRRQVQINARAYHLSTNASRF